MSSKKKLTVKGAVDFQEVVDYLENIVTSFKAGKLTIQKGPDAIMLTPPPIVDFQIEAAEKDAKSKLSIKISWSDDTKYGIQDKVSISSGGPKLDATADNKKLTIG